MSLLQTSGVFTLGAVVESYHIHDAYKYTMSEEVYWFN